MSLPSPLPSQRPEAKPSASASGMKANAFSVMAISRWQPAPLASRARKAKRMFITAGSCHHRFGDKGRRHDRFLLRAKGKREHPRPRYS